MLTMTGCVVGVFCALAARHYDRLMGQGYKPDAASLMAAMQAVVAAPFTPIIGSDDAMGPRVLPVVAGAVSAAILAGLYLRHGGDVRLMPLGVACVILVLLACIDMRVCLLPDALTQPLLWLGLLCAWAGVGLSVRDSIAGVATGYLLLSVPRLLWLWWRKLDAVGAGDVKLLAALGAWVGAFGITRVLAVACIAGVVFAMIHQRSWRPGGAYPFGPFIALAGVAEFLL